MKNSFFFKTKTTLKNNLVLRCFLIATLFFAVTQVSLLYAQGPRLSIQGILKKANGDAVTDGSYNLTFRLYTTPTGPTSAAVWDEIQTGVDVISGIYSTVLGNDSTLNIAFNQLYYLGVTVGSTEMTPRIQLTSAPYALALIGSTNQFPSSGIVKADSIRVAGGVLARGGTPGANGANKNGFAFTGNNGDKDSGLFSTALGQVSLYVNNAPMLTATPDSVAIRSDVRLKNNANINYNGLDDWRLVETDYFENGNDLDGWQAYSNCCGENIGWQNPAADNANPPTIQGSNTNYEGKYIRPSINVGNQVLKKNFNLSNVTPFSYVKVKFKYYFLSCWDGTNNEDNFPFVDAGFAAVAKTADGTGMRMGFYEKKSTPYGWGLDVDTPDFTTANNWDGLGPCSDTMEDGEMTFANCNGCSNSFWLFFGADLNTDPTDERFGVGMIEVWVK